MIVPRLWRIVLDIALFSSVLFAPWWGTVALALILVALAPAYEIVLAGILLDALYAAPAPLFFGSEFVFTAGAVLLVAVASIIKSRLSWYTR